MRRRSGPDDLVRLIGERMSRATPLEDLLVELVELLRSRLGLLGAEVWTGSGGRLRRTVAVPHRSDERGPVTVDDVRVVAGADVRGNTWIDMWIPGLLDGRRDQVLRVAPATSNGELFGLLVAVRGPDDYDEREEAALAELGRVVGMALRNLHLDSALTDTLDELREKADALQDSRARVVAAADEARRGIERDLHDGAQQSLLALGLKAQAAGAALGGLTPDLATAQKLLDELEADIDYVATEVRRLAHGVYPHALHSGGLAEALPTLDRGGTTVHIDVPQRRLPADIETAVYFCCLEAVQNVVKHGGLDATSRLSVTVDDCVRFVVADDGSGFDPADVVSGVGITNMADRLGALGGELDVSSAIGEGTVVTGTIPLPDDPQGLRRGTRAPL